MPDNQTIPKGRTQLSQVLQAANDLISVADVSATLGVPARQATRLLARWNSQGWIKRLRRGFYVPVPIASLGQNQVLDDPWLIVPVLFGPAYVGGWTAAEHWGLTEQVFRGVCVLTTRPTRGKQHTIQGVEFFLKHVSLHAMFGLKGIWRGKVKIEVSTPAKTIIDMLDDPTVGGGIRHVSDCLGTYLREGIGTPQQLLAAAQQQGNGAVFKRLGFLTQRLGGPAELVQACQTRLTAGNSKLDPAVESPNLITRWRLWLPASWAEATNP